MRAGETVDVGGCRNSWCYLTDKDGFVSASYLRRGGAAIGPNFNLSFNFPQGSFTIGNGGVSIGIGQPPRPPGGNGPRRDEACFYSGQNYTGDRFCLDEG